MARRITVTETYVKNIANSIRTKTGETGTFTIAQMAGKIDGILVPSGTVNIATNGTVDVTSYASAAVRVPTTFNVTSIEARDAIEAIANDTAVVTADGKTTVYTYNGTAWSELVHSAVGTVNISANGTVNVADYASAEVRVPTTFEVASIAARDALTPIAGDTAIVTDATTGNVNVYSYKVVEETGSWVEVITTPTGSLNITENGNDIDVKTYATVNVRIPTNYEVATLAERDALSPVAGDLCTWVNAEDGDVTIYRYTASGWNEVVSASVGNLDITTNGSHSVLEYATVNVQVPAVYRVTSLEARNALTVNAGDVAIVTITDAETSEKDINVYEFVDNAWAEVIPNGDSIAY